MVKFLVMVIGAPLLLLRGGILLLWKNTSTKEKVIFFITVGAITGTSVMFLL